MNKISCLKKQCYLIKTKNKNIKMRPSVIAIIKLDNFVYCMILKNTFLFFLSVSFNFLFSPLSLDSFSPPFAFVNCWRREMENDETETIFSLNLIAFISFPLLLPPEGFEKKIRGWKSRDCLVSWNWKGSEWWNMIQSRRYIILTDSRIQKIYF